MIALGIYTAGAVCVGICLSISSTASAAGRPFSFGRDTFAFANETVFEFHDGHAYPGHETGPTKPKRFTNHCFVMSRWIIQFRKFARFVQRNIGQGVDDLFPGLATGESCYRTAAPAGENA